MGIRNSKEENLQINGTINEVIEKCNKALQKGGFKKIRFNETINQFEANYKPVFGTVYGSIKITLTMNNDSNATVADDVFKVQDDGTIVRVGNTIVHSSVVNINVVSTANVDNIYALFSSPNDKILSYFKNNL
jgi:hypothetical protein